MVLYYILNMLWLSTRSDPCITDNFFLLKHDLSGSSLTSYFNSCTSIRYLHMVPFSLSTGICSRYLQFPVISRESHINCFQFRFNLPYLIFKWKKISKQVYFTQFRVGGHLQNQLVWTLSAIKALKQMWKSTRKYKWRLHTQITMHYVQAGNTY